MLGRNPEGEPPRCVLNKDAQETLNRAQQRAVNHHWPSHVTCFIGIFEAKALGLDEVELHRRHLVLAANRIRCHEVDLWSIKGRFALLLEIVQLLGHHSCLELSLGRLPQFWRSKVALTLIAIAQANTQLHPHNAVQLLSTSQQITHLLLDLIWPAKHMAIILRQ